MKGKRADAKRQIEEIEFHEKSRLRELEDLKTKIYWAERRLHAVQSHQGLSDSAEAELRGLQKIRARLERKLQGTRVQLDAKRAKLERLQKTASIPGLPAGSIPAAFGFRSANFVK